MEYLMSSVLIEVGSQQVLFQLHPTSGANGQGVRSAADFNVKNIEDFCVSYKSRNEKHGWLG